VYGSPLIDVGADRDHDGFGLSPGMLGVEACESLGNCVLTQIL
jgi:hypothetical protein